MEKIQSTTVTTKIGYHLIKSPFKYHINYHNSIVDNIHPNCKLISLFGTLARAASKSPWEIKLSVPIDNGGDILIFE